MPIFIDLSSLKNISMSVSTLLFSLIISSKVDLGIPGLHKIWSKSFKLNLLLYLEIFSSKISNSKFLLVKYLSKDLPVSP